MSAIIISALLGVAMMIAGLFIRKAGQVQLLAIIGSLLLLGATWYDYKLYAGVATTFYNSIEINAYTGWFNVIISACFLIYTLIFHNTISRVGKNDAEYYALLFFVMCGVYMMSTYNSLLILFVGIEIMSIPQYILAGTQKDSIKSSEAALKYFLMGAFSTGILLMGITLIYGATGTFAINTSAFQGQFQEITSTSSLSFLGILLLVVSFGFKVSAAPFHYWTPDVYDGTPTAFTPFMSTIVKVAVFLAFLRLFHGSFGSVSEMWQMSIAALIILTLFFGNITAVYQQSVKRMMAYSSIAQAGFMLFAIFAFNASSWQGILLYAGAYTLASLGVFATIAYLDDHSYDGFNGLAAKHPLLAFTTTISLLSLAGIPLTGGFFAKYWVLSAAVEQGTLLGLVIFAVLMAAISVYYYFKVIMSMYFKKGEPTLLHQPTITEHAMLLVNAILIILLGILPGLILS